MGKYRVEDVATPEGFAADPELVLNFYNQRRRELLNTKPNAGHIGLADLEQEFDVISLRKTSTTYTNGREAAM